MIRVIGVLVIVYWLWFQLVTQSLYLRRTVSLLKLYLFAMLQIATASIH